MRERGDDDDDDDEAWFFFFVDRGGIFLMSNFRSVFLLFSGDASDEGTACDTFETLKRAGEIESDSGGSGECPKRMSFQSIVFLDGGNG